MIFQNKFVHRFPQVVEQASRFNWEDALEQELTWRGPFFTHHVSLSFSLSLPPSLSIFFISVCQIGPVITSSVISHSHCFCHPRMLGSWLKVSSIDSPGLSAACEGTSLRYSNYCARLIQIYIILIQFIKGALSHFCSHFIEMHDHPSIHRPNQTFIHGVAKATLGGAQTMKEFHV